MGGMTLKSPSFGNGDVIPKKHGYKNGNVPVPLTIGGVPSDAASLALVMDDPDAMGAVGKVWVHWVMWNMDPATGDVPEDSVPAGAVQGMTDFGDTGYGGPAPPDREHTYVFRLYALDSKLDLAGGSTKADLERAIKGRIVGEARLEGRYSPS